MATLHPVTKDSIHDRQTSENPFYFVILRFLKIYFENHTVQLLSMYFVDCLMLDYHSIEDISSFHEGCLSRSNHMVCHRIQPNWSGLSKNLEANIKETKLVYIVEFVLPH